MNINPIGMAVKDWCDWMVSELRAYGLVAILDDPRNWRQWAIRVSELPGLAGFNPPDPRAFDDFYEWAQRFNGAVQL